MSNFEQSRGPVEIFDHRMEVWNSLIQDPLIGEEERTPLENALRNFTINTFLDKKIFWKNVEPIYKVSAAKRLASSGERTAQHLAAEIMEDMVKAFREISGESPAIS